MIAEKNVVVNGQNLHVYTAGNSDDAILFIHGNSCNGSFWMPQLTDEMLASKYSLIAFDLPGHGQSDKGNNYRPKDMAKVIPALVQQLVLKNYIVVGLSLGTCLAAEAAPELKGCKGFLMASPNLTNNEFHPGTWIVPFPQLAAMGSAIVSDDDLHGFAATLGHGNTEITDTYKKSYLATDPNFRTVLNDAISERDWSDEFANLCETGQPVCLVFGGEEKAINIHYLDGYANKWGDKVHIIENASHFCNNDQPEVFNQLLAEFAQSVFTTKAVMV